MENIPEICFCVHVVYFVVIKGPHVLSFKSKVPQPILNFRLKLQNIIKKLSEHCDVKLPEELETVTVSI